MNWNSKAETLYSNIIERVPKSKKALVERSLRRGAEARAFKNKSTEVHESDVIFGFYDVTPAPFHHQIDANLKGLGIEVSKYHPGNIHEKEQPDHKKGSISALLNDFEMMSSELNVPFNQNKVKAALLAYADQFCRSPVAMRTTTKSPKNNDLAVRYLDLLNISDPDPLTIALSNGFIQDDDHPIFSLFNEIKTNCGGFGYGVDIDATKGFSKIWMAPSIEKNSLELLVTLPHLPQSVKNTINHFCRFGLFTFGLVGFDFDHKTINLYFMIKEITHPEIGFGQLLSDLGIHLDSEELLHSIRDAHVIYYSFSWTSPHVKRICFTTVLEKPEQVPAHFHPRISQCLNNAVFMHGLERSMYSVACSQDGYYFKFDNDYSGTQAFQLIEAGDVGVTLDLKGI